jgi:hypothetical protein
VRVDHAVSLVQAYLQLNGYFTAAEYPLMEANNRGSFRSLTDIDILAFRFPSAPGAPDAPLPGRPAAGSLHESFSAIEPDEGLAVPKDRIDMLIGEVKEGRVNINSGARDPAVLRSVLSRFGCAPSELDALTDGLLRTGSVKVDAGYQVRLIAFGAMPPGSPVPPCRIISLGHVLNFLQAYVRKHWSMLRHCQFKDPAFGFLMTIEKARRGGAGRRGSAGVEIVPPSDETSLSGRRALTWQEPRNGATEKKTPPAPPPSATPRPVARQASRSPKRKTKTR